MFVYYKVIASCLSEFFSNKKFKQLRNKVILFIFLFKYVYFYLNIYDKISVNLKQLQIIQQILINLLIDI